LDPATTIAELRGSTATLGSFCVRRPVLQDNIVASVPPS
jgi:hypothetical protein